MNLEEREERSYNINCLREPVNLFILQLTDQQQNLWRHKTSPSCPGTPPRTTQPSSRTRRFLMCTSIKSGMPRTSPCPSTPSLSLLLLTRSLPRTLPACPTLTTNSQTTSLALKILNSLSQPMSSSTNRYVKNELFSLQHLSGPFLSSFCDRNVFSLDHLSLLS